MGVVSRVKFGRRAGQDLIGQSYKLDVLGHKGTSQSVDSPPRLRDSSSPPLRHTGWILSLRTSSNAESAQEYAYHWSHGCARPSSWFKGGVLLPSIAHQRRIIFINVINIHRVTQSSSPTVRIPGLVDLERA